MIQYFPPVMKQAKSRKDMPLFAIMLSGTHSTALKRHRPHQKSIVETGFNQRGETVQGLFFIAAVRTNAI